MSFYLKLDLPRVPTSNLTKWLRFAFNNRHGDEPFAYADPVEFLKPEILEKLKQSGLRPRTVVLFGNKKKSYRTVNEAFFHSDMVWNGQEWVVGLAGINWELELTKSTFRWWDTSNIPAIMTNTEPPNGLGILRGLHYNQVTSEGALEKSSLLESVEMDGPTLVRTDFAHTVDYENSDGEYRVAASLRFYEDGMSWEDIVSKLKYLELSS